MDVRIDEGNRIIDTYFSQTYKPTKAIIAENASFFSKLSDVVEINIFGHSLSVVDLPYLDKIIKNIDISTTKWNISVYSKDELTRHKNTMRLLGINHDLIKFDKIDNFGKSQLSLFAL